MNAMETATPTERFGEQVYILQIPMFIEQLSIWVLLVNLEKQWLLDSKSIWELT